MEGEFLSRDEILDIFKTLNSKTPGDKNKAAAPVSEMLGLRDDDPELAELFDGPIGSKGADAGATPSTGQQASEASEATGSDVTAAISEAQLREANDASVDGRRGLRSLRPRSRGTASSVCTPVRALCRPTPLLLIAGACACLSTCQVQGEERGLFENHGELQRACVRLRACCWVLRTTGRAHAPMPVLRLRHSPRLSWVACLAFLAVGPRPD